MARIEAERRLKEAEASLGRLEVAVNREPAEASTRNEEQVREEMIGDVKTLKSKAQFEVVNDHQIKQILQTP